MDESTDVQWVEPYAGYTFRPRAMTVGAAEQERLLALCGIDPGVFAGRMDPAGFISLAIQEGVHNRIHANGTVNMMNVLIQHRQVALDEPLTVTGEVLEVEEVPRGRVATSEVRFHAPGGAVAFTSRRKSLRPEPGKAGVRGAGERPSAVVRDLSRLKSLAKFTLTPDAAKAYAGPHNPIHFDPHAAQRSGFRAPIIGGGQGVRFMTAEIYRRFRPDRISMEIFFRRPIYWDDTFAVMVEEAGERWRAICLVKDDKVASEARIEDIA